MSALDRVDLAARRADALWPPSYGFGYLLDPISNLLELSGVLFPQRLGFQEELASMVVECITNSYMNAETIRVDGGIRMPPK